jgi:hypothetical protein
MYISFPMYKNIYIFLGFGLIYLYFNEFNKIIKKPTLLIYN